MKDSLKPGVSLTKRYEIDRERTIDFMGEDLRVYATPAMVLDIERTARALVRQHNDDGEDSVGARIEVDHLGATLLGMWVDVTATVTEVEGPRVSLDVEVRDPLDLVGRGKHVRFAIDVARQKKRLEAKAEKAKAAS